MAIVFIDSFDHYNQFLQKWSSGVATFNVNPARVRTGTQSLTATLPGFANIPRINFGTRSTMICGFAYYADSFGAAGNQISRWWSNAAGGIPYCEIDVGTNGQIVALQNAVQFAQSVPGVLSTGAFFYIECKMICDIVNGYFECRVNGATVMTYTGPLYGPGFVTVVDGFMLMGSSANNTYYDDFYLLDGSGTSNNDFAGAVQIFAILPDANEAPLNFTPLAGTNFSEVNQVPPPGDAAYVFDSNVGDIDQYHYTITGPVGSYSILGIQHVLDCKLDAAGSHTIASQINTHTGGVPQVGSNAPGANYQMVITPWDTNPNTGVAFAPADFATTFVGPKITA